MTERGALHDRLRSATAPLHEAAERAFDAERRLSALEGYVGLLDILWSLHAGLERAMAPHRPHLFGLDPGSRPRSPLLAKDIQALSGRDPELTPVAFAYSAPAAALGGLYVLEGSMLGGRVLFHRARERLAVTEHNGGRFLAGDGKATASRWRAFLHALATLPATVDRDQVEAGARATFQLVIEQLAARSAHNSQPSTAKAREAVDCRS